MSIYEVLFSTNHCAGCYDSQEIHNLAREIKHVFKGDT